MKTIAFITDLHIDEEFPKTQGVDARKNFGRIFDDIRSRNIEHIIIGGDIGENSALPWFFDSLKSFRLDLVLGNHDEFRAVSANFTTITPDGADEWYYSYEDDNFRWLFMDSSSATISPSQFEWLKTSGRTSKPILLFIHHPVLPVDTIVDRNHLLYDREPVKNLFIELGSQVTIFCGHYHTDDASSQGNITQYVTPACSFQVLKNTEKTVIDPDNFGYRLIMIDESVIETSVIRFEV